MSPVNEITVPDTKPGTEWVNGRALQKVSPQERHARAQSHMVAALSSSAENTSAGRIGNEWEFRVTPPHEPTCPLVPDVAFLSYGRLGYDKDEAAQVPYMAPDGAAEIRSPDDRQADIEHKIHVYLAAGTSHVLLFDPITETPAAYDGSGRHEVGSVFRKPKRPD